MPLNRAWLLLTACLLTPITTASANVVTDWDEKAVAFVQPRMVPPVAYRAMAILHIAMFDALNSIEPRYRPYYAQLPATQDTSKEAAAAAAAGAVLLNLLPENASEIQAALQSYLTAIPDSEPKSNGIKLGEAVAAKTLEARASDGSSAPDAYRPLYPNRSHRYSAMAGTHAVRDDEPVPVPPKAADRARERAMGQGLQRNQRARREEQRQAVAATDRRRAILAPDRAAEPHPLHRQIAIRKEMSVLDSARFMTASTAAEADAASAVMDATYKYAFWRPNHRHPQRRYPTAPGVTHTRVATEMLCVMLAHTPTGSETRPLWDGLNDATCIGCVDHCADRRFSVGRLPYDRQRRDTNHRPGTRKMADRAGRSSGRSSHRRSDAVR